MSLNLSTIFGPEATQFSAGSVPTGAENPHVINEVSATEPEPSDDDLLNIDTWYPDGPDLADCFVPDPTLGGLCSPIPSDRRLHIGDRHPAANPYPLAECDRCGSADFMDVWIHNGQSIRRDCTKCRRFMGWPHWHSADASPEELIA